MDVIANKKFYKTEGVWKYFFRERDGQLAQSILCNVTLKCAGGSTKGLHVHLQTKHKISVSKRKAESNDNDH